MRVVIMIAGIALLLALPVGAASDAPSAVSVRPQGPYVVIQWQQNSGAVKADVLRCQAGCQGYTRDTFAGGTFEVVDTAPGVAPDYWLFEYADVAQQQLLHAYRMGPPQGRVAYLPLVTR